MTRRLLSTITAACALAVASNAGAHAFLDHAVPAVGSEVRSSPVQLKLWFTQPLEPAFSTAQVLDRDGKRVDKGDPKVDPTDAKQLVVSLPQLAPGTYHVTWRVLAVDTHVTEGDFTFDIAK